VESFAGDGAGDGEGEVWVCCQLRGSMKGMLGSVHVVRITHRAMPKTRVPMIFLLILRSWTPGKHPRFCFFTLFFFFGLLSASRVRTRVRPDTPTISSSSYLVPAIGERGLMLERSKALGCAGSVPMFGEEVGSMIDRVDDGDLWPDRGPKAVRRSGDSERSRVCHPLGACTKLWDGSLPTTDRPWNHAENLDDVREVSSLFELQEEVESGMARKSASYRFER